MPTELETGRSYTLALRPGTVLDGAFRIARVVGHTSSFAITYLAESERGIDHVIIKEFLPRTLAGRARDELNVHPHSASDEANLARMLRRFRREAELLAEIAHPNVPRVRRYFEANGTGYIAFQYYDGKTVTELAGADGRLRPDRAASLVVQVLQGLEALHAEGIIHGFITPDSVLVDDNSRALILGLGTTRHVVGPAREPTAGFAPIEQYAAKEVGPWTDVYACAAVLYRLTTGLTPPSAVERSTGQALPAPWTTADVPAPLAHTIMSALAQLPDARPHSAEEFRRRVESSLAPASRASGRADRVEQPATNTRWQGSEPAQPAPVAAIPRPEPEVDQPQFDYQGFLETGESPRDRLRRLFRMVLGVGGATAGLLLAVSLLGSRSDNGTANGDVAAEPAPVATARAPIARVEPIPSDRSSPTNVVPLTRTVRGSAPHATLRQAGAAGPHSVAEPTASPPRTRSAPAARSTSGTGSPGSRENSQAAPPAGPPSITLSVPATVGQIELLPSEVISGLRERLAHGNENMESGEYTRARQIYHTALEQIRTLSGRYAGAQALLALKQELERASGRALAACIAENEVAGKRNAQPVQCQ